MAWTGPFRKEFILTCNVCKALLNLLIDRRIYEVQEREECAESIPESCVCIEVSVTDLSVVWAVMDRLACWGNLIEFAWKKKASVQAGIEGAVLVSGTSADLDTSQYLIPSFFGNCDVGLDAKRL